MALDAENTPAGTRRTVHVSVDLIVPDYPDSGLDASQALLNLAMLLRVNQLEEGGPHHESTVQGVVATWSTHHG